MLDDHQDSLANKNALFDNTLQDNRLAKKQIIIINKLTQKK
jgi:hypothetical protein